MRRPKSTYYEKIYMNICCHATVPLQANTYHINVISLEYKRMSQIVAQTTWEQKFNGTNVPGSEYF